MLRSVRTLDVRPQLPASLGAALVLFGDLLGLLLFVSWGLYEHNLLAWEVPVHTAETLTPFLAAWLALAPLFCLYHHRTLRSYRRTFLLLVPGWVIIALVAAAIRASQFFEGGAGVTFVLVNIAFGLLVLIPWRLGAVALLRR
ncbi:DUF3054 family protein [Halovenus rubra]|uniref:DUF3054 family protein n=2 Tax=Halovenus rubra TaxID=869890 RepID=A0ABD5X484_9EURY|nr:DUF3054 family protein [Halovenus rubra]